MKKQNELLETRKEYNLLDEDWIKVMRPDLSIETVSLKAVFAHAHEYVQLAGEMETQNAAILRLLLSVLMSVFYRYDPEGNYLPFNKESDADFFIERWEDLWNRGFFPSEVIDKYLEKYRERFWLIHPTRPFWQVSGLDYGTDYDTKTLFGDIKESNNSATMHHFSQKAGKALEEITFSEGVRWLIHLNAYSINVKPKSEVGRMGKIGFLMFKGKNLFETLMFNFTFLRDGTELWGAPNPIWEHEKVNTEMNKEVSIPDNYPELYTIQSRRILLFIQNSRITGYRMAPGDVLDNDDLFCEQMTKWRLREDKKTKETWQEPEVHDPSIQAWREFPSLISTESDFHKPGIVRWLEILLEEGILESDDLVVCQTVGMTYGNMSYAFEEAFSDALTLSAGLFSELSRTWQRLIINEIQNCSKIADKLLGTFADDLCRYLYGEKSKSLKNQQVYLRSLLKEKYYDLIDADFRKWLMSIQPKREDNISEVLEWRRISARAAGRVAKEQIAAVDHSLFVLRKGKERVYSIPQILNYYLGSLKRIYGNLDQ